MTWNTCGSADIEIALLQVSSWSFVAIQEYGKAPRGGAMLDGTGVPFRPGRPVHVHGVVARGSNPGEIGKDAHDSKQGRVCCMTKRFMRWSGVASEVWRL